MRIKLPGVKATLAAGALFIAGGLAHKEFATPADPQVALLNRTTQSILKDAFAAMDQTPACFKANPTDEGVAACTEDMNAALDSASYATDFQAAACKLLAQDALQTGRNAAAAQQCIADGRANEKALMKHVGETKDKLNQALRDLGAGRQNEATPGAAPFDDVPPAQKIRVRPAPLGKLIAA